MLKTKVLPLLLMATLSAAAQSPGSVDPEFAVGSFTANSVQQIEYLPDGRIIIAGSFINFNHQPVNHVARLNSDFTIDETFHSSSGFTAPFTVDLYDLDIQADGKILIIGNFTKYDGIGRKYIVRLNSDGTVDMGFDPGTSFNNFPYCATIQSDSKILIGGNFTTAFAMSHNSLLRLNSDGTLDMTFSNAAAQGPRIHDILQDPDGQILFCGEFLSADEPDLHIIRLSPTGAVDNTFKANLGTGPASDLIWPTVKISEMTLQPDGRILAFGTFKSFNGFATNSFVRLNSDGTVDETFISDVSVYATSYEPFELLRTSSGDFILSGNFEIEPLDGLETDLVKISSTGELIQSWNVTGSIEDIDFDADENILAVNPNTLNDAVTNRIVKILSDGTTDLSIMPSSAFEGFSVYDIVEQPDGKLLAGGDLNYFGDHAIGHFTRLNPDGTADTTFHSVAVSGDPGPAGNSVRDIELNPDGSIYVVGNFVSFGGYARKRIVKLHPDGTVDPTFGAFTGANAIVYGVAVQPDGKVLIGGNFKYYNGVPCDRVIRLLPDGEQDFTFNAPNPNYWPLDFHVMPDGKILMIGEFLNYDGTGKNGIVRLNSDGTHDLTFNSGNIGPNNDVTAIQIDYDGRIVIIGSFDNYNGVSRNKIARLNPDGTLDMTFNPGTGFNGILNFPSDIEILPDNSILVAGNMTKYNGANIFRTILINTDGTMNESFDVGDGAYGIVYSIELLEDGNIIAGGSFNQFHTSTSNRIVRLFGVDLPCDPPTGITVDAITTTNAIVHWDPAVGADYTDIWYRPVGAAPWSKKTSNTDMKKLKSLTAGTDYEFKLRTQCLDGDNSSFTPLYFFSTLRTGEFKEMPAISCYPNPASGTLTIENPAGNSEINIMNSTGAVVATYFIGEGENLIDISRFAEGVYFIISTDASFSPLSVIIQN